MICQWIESGGGVVCRACGARSNNRRRQICGHSPHDGTPEQLSGPCPHLGPVSETITRDLLACGCQTIRLHRCEQFGELVTVQPIRRPNAVDTAEALRAAVSEFFPGYTGRTCRGCEIIPAAIPASHPSKRID